MLRAVISMLLVLSQLKLSISLYVFSPPHAAPVSSSPSSLKTEDSSYTVSSSPSSLELETEDSSYTVSSSPSSLELETEDSSYTGLPPAYDFSAVLYSLGQMPDMTDIWEC